MFEIVIPPNKAINKKSTSIFLAGGIIKDDNWQEKAINILQEKCYSSGCIGLTIYNPRKEKIDFSNYKETEEQILWEYRKLKEADIVLFWFSKFGLNPLSLYKLGKWENKPEKKIYIGCENITQSFEEMFIQIALDRPDLKKFNNLKSLCTSIFEDLLKK
jgi:hypothetical protein